MAHPGDRLLAYTSSEAVKNGISVAYSTFYNTRGLENMWNSPFGRTLHEIVSPYDGELLVYSPHTLWIPADDVKERKLRQAFNELGLDYDNQPPKQQDISNSDNRDSQTFTEDEEVDQDQDDDDNDDNDDNADKPRRTSKRRLVNEQKALVRQKKEEGAHLKNLRAQRHKFIDEQEAALKVLEDSDYGNTSYDSMHSVHQRDAKDYQPDLYVGHVKTVKLVHTDDIDDISHSTYRAYRKTYHDCGVLIVELKSGASRTTKGRKFNMETKSQIREASGDLFRYCIAYFAVYPNAQYVTAVATGGVFWSWSKIDKDDVPAWDGQDDDPEEYEQKEQLFTLKFEENLFILGTEESDHQWTEVNNTCIYPLTMDHLPGVPEANPRVAPPE
ncbi:hypothetical protein GALMADRAFT_1366824 [Galerina marginata CBS 339.88]|uniref:Uncharacterized protein n=1 Tax=Galerina marginata (strain CBS 339.88) TaxID=685588 RepID=A0A067T4R8_GALM3|nr:hypothetical protein GALMADRAFT_1366824 [Galerina marginata CBS 339.88]